MAPNQPKKAHPRLQYDTTGPQVWEKMQEFFEEEREYMKRVRDEDGLEEAQFEHTYQMANLGKRDMWEAMFLQAYLREPQSAQAIKEAQLSYLIFHNSIQSKEEEQIGELRSIRENIRQALEELRDYIKECKANSLMPNVKLDLSAEDELDEYSELAENSSDARAIIEQIRVIIDEIHRLKRRHCK